jgi:hypothetical protein
MESRCVVGVEDLCSETCMLLFNVIVGAQMEKFNIHHIDLCHVKWLSEGWYICHNKQMQLWHVTFATIFVSYVYSALIKISQEY